MAGQTEGQNEQPNEQQKEETNEGKNEEEFWNKFDKRLDSWFDRKVGELRRNPPTGTSRGPKRTTLPSIVADLFFGPEKQ